MKIIEQYIYAIGQKLPLKGRKDVKEELRSLLLDEIEAKFGSDPSEEEVKSAISDFGSPSKVARRYSGDRLVIATGFTDIYYLIFWIIIFAMAVAFTTIFFINLFTKDLAGIGILMEIGQLVLSTWNASLSGIGMMTIVFIIISRFLRESKVDLEEDWTPKDLKGIPLGEEAESKIESFFSIFFLLILLAIVNLFPGLLTFAENSFEQSGLILGNRIEIDRFTIYAIFMSLVWIGDLIYHVMILKTAMITKPLKFFSYAIDLSGIIIFLLMVSDKSLFQSNPAASMPSILGFKAIFLLILIISSAELIVKGVKELLKKAEG
ncbi:hypothetical protein [Spirochaeta isovalerica]|uniref:Uncharacterized protein n=1 Tax=Spirochaeta isovalerica TaxID=150 RepID=A0A841R8F5_9SPIO|nr:hypothetical protein [Spirochaeta isovalerica]MBB6479310.1 hypothetical protein [Spirochaeta isovalerica]